MADAADSKSVARKGVWVRLPPPAPIEILLLPRDFRFYRFSAENSFLQH